MLWLQLRAIQTISYSYIVFDIPQINFKLEMWIDRNNNNTWTKIHEYVDKGGWGSTMNRCEGTTDQLITWGSPVVTFRWDDTADVDCRDLSVREIQSP
jgi:hypothetical protein